MLVDSGCNVDGPAITTWLEGSKQNFSLEELSKIPFRLLWFNTTYEEHLLNRSRISSNPRGPIPEPTSPTVTADLSILKSSYCTYVGT